MLRWSPAALTTTTQTSGQDGELWLVRISRPRPLIGWDRVWLMLRFMLVLVDIVSKYYLTGASCHCSGGSNNDTGWHPLSDSIIQGHQCGEDNVTPHNIHQISSIRSPVKASFQTHYFTIRNHHNLWKYICNWFLWFTVSFLFNINTNSVD